MGLPLRSPISDRFHGTTYMTFGCSRSPVTVAVPKSSRSVLGADFWPDPEPGAGWPAAAGVAGVRPVDGAGAADGAGAGDAPGAAAGSLDVSARGSPASDCAVAWLGLTEGAAGVAAGGAACCCATAGPVAQNSAIKLAAMAWFIGILRAGYS